MHTRRAIAQRIAAAFLAGSWDENGLVERAGKALGKRRRWLRPLAKRAAAAFAPKRPALAAVVRFIGADAGFERNWRHHDSDDELPRPVSFGPARMYPAPGTPATWQVPSLATPGALAEWLGLTPGELDWFADRQSRESRRPAGTLRHYLYRWVVKRSGGVRLIEQPKSRLKAIQQEVLHAVLDRIPPHAAAHGFRAGRSVKTFALPHTRQRVVLRVDLQDFFASVSSAWVTAVYLTAGYPDSVAALLAGLCTNCTPRDVCLDEPWQAARSTSPRFGRLFHRPHLPQGAPTSPALANLCAYRLDCRLSGLARSAGAVYTRYADDLVFSGGLDLQRSARRFHIRVCSIALEEGFAVHTRKTRIMRQGVRQQIAGVVINQKPNIRRSDYDTLKATLYNCVRHGPDGQNHTGCRDFRARLAGQISYVAMLNPQRGARLKALFDQVAW